VQAITFRSEDEMVAAAAKLPLGSLAFIVSDEQLFLRIRQGLREVQVTTLVCYVSALRNNQPLWLFNIFCRRAPKKILNYLCINKRFFVYL